MPGLEPRTSGELKEELRLVRGGGLPGKAFLLAFAAGSGDSCIMIFASAACSRLMCWSVLSSFFYVGLELTDDSSHLARIYPPSLQ